MRLMPPYLFSARICIVLRQMTILLYIENNPIEYLHGYLHNQSLSEFSNFKAYTFFFHLLQ